MAYVNIFQLIDNSQIIPLVAQIAWWLSNIRSPKSPIKLGFQVETALEDLVF